MLENKDELWCEYSGMPSPIAYIKQNDPEETSTEDYIMVRKDLLEELKDFDTWKKWKHQNFDLNKITK